MKILSLTASLFAILLMGAAHAQSVNITFPTTTPVSRTATSPILCKTRVVGYEFDSTLLGANLSPTTCTAANLFPSTPPGDYLAVGVLRTGTAGYVDITPRQALPSQLIASRSTITASAII